MDGNGDSLMKYPMFEEINADLCQNDLRGSCLRKDNPNEQ